ncbi:hypothetical protein NDI76_02620 [Halogeometricum sp. S1BR25-6]|uniref:Halobacterial output domain-containing protein n=1 Tax=Halogeometricum salsisoli TaxID=2950536 RepID=A0ABU2G9Z4_9EURY|nr:HalOD1 output domain-containing protein [Halogeometricum sp. S1BR25-6]MDS0297632.1 hypothetical protein [Halogeometricum sp. S1BR25-6]
MTKQTTSTGPDGRSIPDLSYDELANEIVGVVAETKGCDPTTLRPVSQVMDAEAADRVLENPNTGLSVAFEYEDGVVRVDDHEVRFEMSKE